MMMFTSLRQRGPIIGMIALLGALVVVLAGCGEQAQPNVPTAEPASAAAQPEATPTRASLTVASPTTVHTATQARPTTAPVSTATPEPTVQPTIAPSPTVDPSFSVSVATDRAALVALYKSADGPNWNSNRNWLSDAPLNQWFGVVTDDDGRVISLNINNNQLRGEIPPQLGNLANLQYLILYGNQLNGQIPAELGNLTNLEQLGLQDNQLTGVIPTELGNLTNLREMRLYSNRLTGAIPPELGYLTSLKLLRLDGNQLFGGIPVELGSLSNLEGLRLGVNQLRGTIPIELGNLDKLQRLSLDDNQLTGAIPSELGGLGSLEYLRLSWNQLAGKIPPELGSLTNTRSLYLDHNQLSGEIPAELGNLANLEDITLSGNPLTGCVPAAFRNIRSNELVVLGLPFCAQASSATMPPPIPATGHVSVAGENPMPSMWSHRPVFNDGTDLSVTYIERIPRLQRYKIAYFRRGDCRYPFDEFKGPIVCPEQDGIKRWPDPGETVELTAHVWNFGDKASGPFEYEWKMNGTLLKASRHNGLRSGEHAKFTISMEWPAHGHNPTVAFAADTRDEIEELIEDNNVVVDWMKGYTLGFYFSPESYESLTLSNVPGRRIQSPEHWLHNNIAHLNEMLADAGLDDRVRAELFFITEDINLDERTALRWYMDGMWKIWHQDPWDPHVTSIFSLEGYERRPEIDYGLLHELMHQLGAIDLYRMSIDTGAVLLKDANRQGQGAGCGTDYWPSAYMCFRFPGGIADLMEAGPPTIGEHTAGGLKTNAGHRRGYYGEYLYDTPNAVSVRIVDQDGKSLPNVDLRFYQYEHQEYSHLLHQERGYLIDAISEFEITTDGNGIAILPNRGITGIVTATGHQLKPNPFGVIDVVGTNGTFVIEMEGPCINYEWLTIVELNLAYWDGQKDHATFTKTLRCPPP